MDRLKDPLLLSSWNQFWSCLSYWDFWWLGAVLFFGISVVVAACLGLRKRKRVWILQPHIVLILGALVSGFILYFPLYIEMFKSNPNLFDKLDDSTFLNDNWINKIKSVLHHPAFKWVMIVILSMVNSVGLLFWKGGIPNFFDALSETADPALHLHIYMLFITVFSIVTPVLSLSWVLTWFKNIWTGVRYHFSAKTLKIVHVFSELNEKSLALARSIREEQKKAVIVFTGVTQQCEDNVLNASGQTAEIRAICFEKDLFSVKFRRKHFKKQTSFYLMSDDENEKIRQAEKIMRDYGHIRTVKLYLFSDSIESKCFLKACLSKDENCATEKPFKLEVRRVGSTRALIYRDLDENGIRLFESAVPSGDVREISAVVLGLGRYGTEMLQALLWYCQMPGYRVNIAAFDERKNIEDIVRSKYPELSLNTDVNTEGDMRYTLNVMNATFGTDAFYQKLMALPNIQNVKYIFICLGDDSRNIQAATDLKAFLAKEGLLSDIRIKTIVYDSALKKRLLPGFRDDHIELIGDRDTCYTFQTVVNSPITGAALEVHKRWQAAVDKEKNFYMDDYNYGSSMSSALHRNLRIKIHDYLGDQIEEIKKAEEQAKTEEQAKAEAAKKAQTVFPFYYSAETDALLKDIFSRINKNETILPLSEDMVEVENYLYIKLASLHYAKLSLKEKRILLENLHRYLKKLPEYVQSPEYFEDIFKEMKGSVNYKEHIKSCMDLFKKLSEDAEKYMQYLDGLIKDGVCRSDFDPLKAFRSYDQEIEMTGDNLKKIKKKIMRKMFDLIVEIKAANITSAEEKHRLALSLEYGSLPDRQTKNEVGKYVKDKFVEYVKSKPGKSPDENFRIEDYFEKALWFAKIEHIRWNAYLRTEGFSLSLQTDRSNRLHYDLVPVELLTFADHVKDI